MTNINPAMITLGRESRGWTQRDLARTLNTRQGTISKYELGLLAVPAHHLDAISHALDYDQAFFQQPDPRIGLGGDFLYRKRAKVTARTQRRVEAEANVRKMQVLRLMQGALVNERFPFPIIDLDEVNGRVEKVAQEVRRAFRLPHGPISNITRVLENAGAIVFTIDFGTDLIDGTNIRLPGVPPLLFLNQNVPGERHRFNLAHELGHAVMHFSTALGDPESEANAFAQEFLMPKAEIRTDLRNLDLTAAMRLKQVWGVSMAAIIRRAHDLNQISEAAYRRLFTAMNARGMRTQEPMPLPFEQPEAFDQLIELHRSQLDFGADDFRRLLFTDHLGELAVPEPQPSLRLVDGGLFDQASG